MRKSHIEIGLIGKIHEAAEDEWDKAIELWFYDHPSGFSSHVLQVLEDNAVPVYRELLEHGFWGPGNCDAATQAWKRVFDREGVQSEVVNGFYSSRHKPGQAHMSSAEHVWMEVEGGVFDPTAGQFKGRLSLNNYWWDDTTHAYGPQAGAKPVYEARAGSSAIEKAETDQYDQKLVDKIIAAYSSITDEDVAAMEELGIFKLAKSPGSVYDENIYRDDKALDFLDNISDLKPLFAVFRTGNFISVDELESKLRAIARRGGGGLELAADALPGLIKHVRKMYAELVAKSEAEPDDPLGRIAFAGDRKGVPHELDTQIEEKLRDALIRHFDGIEILNKKYAQMLQDFMAQGLYPRMFSEPSAPVLFRGMGVSSSWLARALGRRVPMKGSAEVDFTFVPKKGASSWTTSKKVAEGFHDYGSDANITMYASVSDNPGKFLSAERGLYSVESMWSYKNEKESFGLGPIKVFKIEWEISD